MQSGLMGFVMKVNNLRIRGLLNIIINFAVPIIIYIILSFILPDKISISNIGFLITQAIMPAILAWGASFNLTAGHSDFSIGASVLFASIMGGNIALSLNLGVWSLLILCPVFGMVSSGIVGLLFVTLKIPSMIVSIGVMLVFESICSVVFGGVGVNLPISYIVFGSSGMTIIFGIIIFLLAFYLFNYNTLGYHVRALGSNLTIAKVCGLDIRKLRIKCFVCVGFFAGLYAAMSLGTSTVAKPVSAMGTMRMAFDAMMCYMVGTSVAGSINVILAIFVGSLYMQLVNLTLTAVNFPSVFTQTVIAFFVLIVMVYSALKHTAELHRQHEEEFRKAAQSYAAAVGD